MTDLSRLNNCHFSLSLSNWKNFNSGKNKKNMQQLWPNSSNKKSLQNFKLYKTGEMMLSSSSRVTRLESGKTTCSQCSKLKRNKTAEDFCCCSYCQTQIQPQKTFSSGTWTPVWAVQGFIPISAYSWKSLNSWTTKVNIYKQLT